MHFIFSSITCSNEEYLNVQNLKHREKLNPSQKYFDMFLKGLAAHENVNISCVTARAIAASTSKVRYLKSKKETSNEIKYRYLPIFNFNIFRNFFNFLLGFIYTWHEILTLKKNGPIYFIADPLAYDISLGSLLASKFFHLKSTAIITDLPIYMAQIQKDGKKIGLKKRFRACLMNSLISLFDSYVFLTESMNMINKKNKPYVIIEGMTYSNIVDEKKDVQNNIVLYAGGLFEQFGIKKLVDAATKVDIPGFELQLYGDGLCIDYINEINQKYPFIKYMGTLSLDEIVKVEKNAKILVNPRPSTEAFTEYSFPSKTIEYMSTGRPVLTTPLKGIPKEYFDYLLLIDENDYSLSLKSSLMKSSVALNEIGQRGLSFVIERKNNIKAGLKFISLVNQL